MDFFSKFTKSPDQSKPASEGQEPSSTTEASNADLFSSAKVVAGAAQSYFSHQPATYENAEVAGATADILGAASEYGKLDKTQGVGKYVDQAETYLKEYETSNTTAPPTATPATETAADADVKPAPTTEAAETDTAAPKDEPSKPELGEDTTADLSSKAPAVDAPVETDQTSGVGATTKTDASDDYQEPIVDKYEEATEEDVTKKKPAAAATDASEDYAKDTEKGISNKPSSGDGAAEVDSGDSGYTEDTEEGLPKPSAGGYAVAGDDAGEKVSQAGGGFGNFTKVAGDFLNK